MTPPVSLVTTVPSGAMRYDSGTPETPNDTAMRPSGSVTTGQSPPLSSKNARAFAGSSSNTTETTAASPAQRVALLEVHQLGVLADARDAPGGEHVDEHVLAAERVEIERLAVDGLAHDRRRLAAEQRRGGDLTAAGGVAGGEHDDERRA